MKYHHLKCVQPFFSDIWNGDKSFDLRKNDRDFQKGDRIKFIEFDPETGAEGRTLDADIIYILSETKYGLRKNHVILGLFLV